MSASIASVETDEGQTCRGESGTIASPTRNHTIPSPPGRGSRTSTIESREWRPPLPRHSRRQHRAATARSPRRPARRATSTTPASIRAAYATLDDAFDGYPHAIHYALKANSSLAIVRLLHSLGSHADANSLGEVDVALRCGFRPDQIVFTGVGKSAAEIDRAVSLGLLAINVESPGELDRIDQRAVAQNVRARVALRVNPDIDAKSHPHISTGLKSNKFGVPIDEAPALFREMAARRGLQPVGAHVHIGSQITTLDPLEQGGARRWWRSRTRCAATASSCSISTWAAGSAFPTTAARWSIPAEYVRALVRRHARQRPEGGDRAGPRAGRAGRRAADEGRRRQAVSRREAIRRGRRRHDRADAAGALQRLSSHRAARPPRTATTPSSTSSGRSARAPTPTRAIARFRRSRSAI